jgi:hypothetical protein
LLISCSPNPRTQRLVASKENGERVYLETVNTDFSLLGVLTVELLATHADNEAYLGDPDHAYILVTPTSPSLPTPVSPKPTRRNPTLFHFPLIHFSAVDLQRSNRGSQPYPAIAMADCRYRVCCPSPSSSQGSHI